MRTETENTPQLMKQQALIEMVKSVAKRRNLPIVPDFPLNIHHRCEYIKGVFQGIRISIFVDNRKVVIDGKVYALTPVQFGSLCN